MDTEHFIHQLSQTLAEEGPRPSTLCVDFTPASFIEIDVLLYALALIADRKDPSLHTSIALPTNPHSNRVLHFLRGWLFPEAVEAVTGRQFSAILEPKSKALYLSHVSKWPEPLYIGGYVREDTGRILSNNYFGIQSFPLAGDNYDEDTMAEHSNSWEMDRIKRVLINVLGRDVAGLVASTVVFESLLNALRHSSAKMIQTTSQLCPPSAADTGGERFDAPYLRYCCWDDGDAMTKTLSRAISSGKPIRACISDRLHKTFSVSWLHDREWDSKVMLSDVDPTESSTDIELLVATFFPGVTCDVTGAGLQISKTLAENLARAASLTGLDLCAHPELLGPGMGLYLLLNTAVDVSCGSIIIRTGDLVARLSAPSAERSQKGEDYEVTVWRTPPSVPPLRGNLITVNAKSRP
jgi:hypothetical protein